ncbi:MAG: DUF1631 family protein [Casimicrobiaceae bacterium]
MIADRPGMDEVAMAPPGGDAGAEPPSAPAQSGAILRECLRLLATSLRQAARTSIDTASDLFEGKRLVSDKEELDFLTKRESWLEQFESTLGSLGEKRLGGARRKGRRPDVDVSLATLRVLDPFDQDKQAGISRAAAAMHRLARQELDALDLRVAVLLDEPVVRDLDNPFGPDYIVDAVGASARELFPHPRVWRPFMERILNDLAAAVPKSYITLNRLLADRGVLPEIKAALRARSELRPANDRDLLPLFARLLEDAGADIESIDVEVPPILADLAEGNPDLAAAGSGRRGSGPQTLPGAVGKSADAEVAAPARLAAPGAGPSPASQPASEPEGASVADEGPLLDLPLPAGPPARDQALAKAAVAQAAAAWSASTPPMPVPPPATDGFPSLDPMLAMGASSAVFEVLAQWQRFDPEDQATRTALTARGVDTAALPLNRVPYLRVALPSSGITPTDKITMDVISLLFDYIFRDPSIPESTRGIFGRLQVPILKAALLERSFFSDRKNPARRVLDRLASAAVGAGSDKGYRVAFEGVAGRVVDQLCRDFGLDLAVFDRADAELLAFLESEHRTVANALTEDIEAALSAEARESDHAHAHALVRDRLAGLRLPVDVRLFAETAWAEYVAKLRADDGKDGAGHRAALQTLDDLLWSITAKERTAQKARLTRMVPGIIGSLRKGCQTVSLDAERSKAFFDTLYELHIAAIKVAKPPQPAPAPAAAAPGPARAAGDGASPSSPSTAAAGAAPVGAGRTPGSATPAHPATREQDAIGTGGFGGTDNCHDYVSEIAVGTWLAFRSGDAWINARLAWVSPLRTKYIFTSRARTTAFVCSPEELAWQLRVGQARLVLEPVPLFDRAVSAALDSIAAQRPAAAAAEAKRAAAGPGN